MSGQTRGFPFHLDMTLGWRLSGLTDYRFDKLRSQREPSDCIAATAIAGIVRLQIAAADFCRTLFSTFAPCDATLLPAEYRSSKETLAQKCAVLTAS